MKKLLYLFFILCLGIGYLTLEGWNTANAQSGSFTFTSAGDHGNGSNFKNTLDLAVAGGASFHVAVGDNSYSAGAEENWCKEFNIRGPRDNPFKAILIVGNHDTGGSSGSSGGNINIYKTKLGCTFPFGNLNGNYGHQYYFDYPQTSPLARFILIRPGIGGDGSISYGLNQPGYVFTRDAIDSARVAGIKWIIVGMHKNCMTTGSKSGCQMGQDLLSLLINKRVDLVLQGHDHNYQRSYSLSCFTVGSTDPSCIADDGSDGYYTKGAGTVIVITGTGGAGLYNVNSKDPEAGYFAKINSTTYGATKFEVSSTQLIASTLRSSGSSFSDSFTISGSGGNTPTPNPTGSPTSTPSIAPGSADINHDGKVDSNDMKLVFHSWLETDRYCGSLYQYFCDLVGDNKINAFDSAVIVANWGNIQPTPTPGFIDHVKYCNPNLGPDAFTTDITNKYLPFSTGMQNDHVLYNSSTRERVRMRILKDDNGQPKLKDIAGVKTLILEEYETTNDNGDGNGQWSETSYNWFAQTKTTDDPLRGTVCYFGEDVCTGSQRPPPCGDGGSWEAGKNNALAGIMMPPPAYLIMGMNWMIEDARNASENAVVMSTGDTFTTPAGTFNDVVYIEEANGTSEKRYAPGVGMIFDDEMVLRSYLQ